MLGGMTGMKSEIVKHLRPEFEPVAVVWSNTIPDDAIQFKQGKFGCILYLFAAAMGRGKAAGGSRESIVCTGGRAALAGSIMHGTDVIRFSQGPDCTSLTAFAYKEAEQPEPRAVLGMLGIAGREVMHKRFRDNIMTLT